MSHANSEKDMPAHANLHSIMLMIVAMGAFTIADLLIKIAEPDPSGGAGDAHTWAWFGIRVPDPDGDEGRSLLLTPLRQPAMMLRNVGDVVGSLSMCLALAYVPISTIGAVIQAVPLMLTAAGALFLGERVGVVCQPSSWVSPVLSSFCNPGARTSMPWSYWPSLPRLV